MRNKLLNRKGFVLFIDVIVVDVVEMLINYVEFGGDGDVLL